MKMENSEIREALTQAKERLGWSVAEWSRKAELSEGTLRNFLAGTSNSLTVASLSKLASAANTTVGEILNQQATDFVSDKFTSTHMIHVRELDIRASGGDGALIGEEEKEVANWRMPEKLVSTHTLADHQTIRIIQVVGDSMVPDFQPGDRIMVDTTDRRPSPPGVFVLWDGLGLVVKRLEYFKDGDEPMVVLISANPAYEKRSVRLEDCFISGRVIGKWLWT